MRAILSTSLAFAVGIVWVAGLPSAAGASESGMASIHTWKKVGRKTCLDGHQHAGSGTGPNRKVAELNAIRDWSGFTDLEYGSSWANFNNSIERSMRCSGNPGSVQCELDATPCRPW